MSNGVFDCSHIEIIRSTYKNISVLWSISKFVIKMQELLNLDSLLIKCDNFISRSCHFFDSLFEMQDF